MWARYRKRFAPRIARDGRIAGPIARCWRGRGACASGEIPILASVIVAMRGSPKIGNEADPDHRPLSTLQLRPVVRTSPATG